MTLLTVLNVPSFPPSSTSQLSPEVGRVNHACLLCPGPELHILHTLSTGSHQPSRRGSTFPHHCCLEMRILKQQKSKPSPKSMQLGVGGARGHGPGRPGVTPACELRARSLVSQPHTEDPDESHPKGVKRGSTTFEKRLEQPLPPNEAEAEQGPATFCPVLALRRPEKVFTVLHVISPGPDHDVRSPCSTPGTTTPRWDRCVGSWSWVSLSPRSRGHSVPYFLGGHCVESLLAMRRSKQATSGSPCRLSHATEMRPCLWLRAESPGWCPWVGVPGQADGTVPLGTMCLDQQPERGGSAIPREREGSRGPAAPGFVGRW